jgi:multidrug resistance protein
MHKKQRPLWLMALTILIDFTGFGLIIPLLPFWAERLGANAVGVGLILTVYALAQFIFTPILGGISDRYGRKPIILFSLLIEVIAFALTALAGSLPFLLVARFIGGLGASNIGSAQAVVSDITTAEDRAKGMGLIGASIGLGFVIGPLLGGILAPLGATVPFWAAGIIALVNALLVLFMLPETRNLRTQDTEYRSKAHLIFSGWNTAIHYPAVIAMVTVNLFYTVAFTAMETVFPLFTQHTFGWGAAQNGYVFTYIGILIVIMQGGLVGRLVKRWGEQRTMLVGLVLMAIGLASLAFSTQLAWLLITLGILSIGDGAVTPLVSTLVSFASPADAQGETLGFAQGIAGLGRIIGPLLAGSAYAFGGPAVPLVGGGILVVLAAVVAIPVLSSIHKPAQAQAKAGSDEIPVEAHSTTR